MYPIKRYALLPIFVALLFMQGCATITAPYRAAETAEQKAFALYGTFVVFEERGAAVINDQRIDIDIRRAIQRADLAAKPVADSTIEAALEVQRIREQLDTDEDKLVTVTRNLEGWVDRFEPLVTNLITAVRGAKQ